MEWKWYEIEYANCSINLTRYIFVYIYILVLIIFSCFFEFLKTLVILVFGVIYCGKFRVEVWRHSLRWLSKRFFLDWLLRFLKMWFVFETLTFCWVELDTGLDAGKNCPKIIAEIVTLKYYKLMNYGVSFINSRKINWYEIINLCSVNNAQTWPETSFFVQTLYL